MGMIRRIAAIDPMGTIRRTVVIETDEKANPL
jgi:hypothetical protein